MSSLKEALAAFEKEQTKVSVDHEDEDDGSMAKLSENNDTSHYQKVEKSKLLKANNLQTKYTGNFKKTSCYLSLYLKVRPVFDSNKNFVEYIIYV